MPGVVPASKRAVDDRARTVVVFAGGGTGGHLYPALALADAMVSLRPDLHPFFVGSDQGIEARVLPERGADHHLVRVQGLRRGRTLENVRVLSTLRAAVVDVMKLYRTLNPELVVVTGGFAAAPAGLAAVFRRVPLALQEQNALPGLTTKLLSRFARQIFVAFEEAGPRLRTGRKTIVTRVGNPVRPLERAGRAVSRQAFGLDEDSTVLLVSGGSQGSAALNRVVLEMVTTVEREGVRPAGLEVLWSTGPTHVETIAQALAELGHPTWVKALGYIDDIPSALAASNLAVARAGAMTTAEFMCVGLPAILVPLPTSAEDHQTWNARALADAGAAIHAPQSELSGSSLLARVRELLESPDRLVEMAEAARALGQSDAARLTAEHLVQMLPPPRAALTNPGAS